MREKEIWIITETWHTGAGGKVVRQVETPSTAALFRWYAKRAAAGQTTQSVAFQFDGYLQSIALGVVEIGGGPHMSAKP
jgi:hypothetical protein